MRLRGLFGVIVGLAVSSMLLSCGSDPPGDGLVVLHIDRSAVGTVVRELQFTVAKVAVFYGTAPIQSILPCTLCDLTGATLPSIPTTTPVRLEFTSTGDTLLGGFSTHPGRISEVRLFVSDVQVTTTDGRVLPGDVVGFHGSLAPKVTCLSPPVGGTGKLDELTVLRLVPGASDDIEVATDQTTTVVTSIDPNGSFPVLKVADISQPDGSPLHVLKLRINSNYDLRLLPDPTLQPGVFMDQVTVMFKLGTTLADVTALNAQIGASVAIAPILGTAYRIQFPTSVGLQAAFSFYAGQPQVQGVLPATNYAMQDLTPNDGPEPNQSIFNLPAAWQVVQTDIGSVGSRTVRVAVIDVGVDMTHPDLFQNIAINQGEIPASLRSVLKDTDNDGIISFVDLNDPQNAAVKPPDSNGNGFIDCKDLLASTTWADGIDDDSNSLVDDICGWNFIDNTNDASPEVDNGTVQEHATMVSGIIGAVGNNGQGIAGDAWAVSIVPIRANAVSTTTGAAAIMPDVSFIDAAVYCEKQGIDIANISQGWQVASENANLSCANAKLQTTTGVPQSQFDMALATAQNAFRMPPWTDTQGNPTSRVLYVFSAGNSKLNLADPNIVHIPKELMQAVIPDSILIVGAVKSATMNSDYSDYGAPVVNIWAPGDNWTSLSPGGGTDTGSGTSFASPAVAGVAALVVATTPTIVGNPGEIQSRLIGRAAASVNVNVGCGAAESARPLLDANASVQP